MGLRNSKDNDLINQLGAMAAKKSASTEGTGNPGPNQSAVSNSTNDSKSTSAATEGTKSVETKPVSNKVEPSETEVLVSDPDSWSKDSAFKEIKKLREENKAVRLKYEESVNTLKTEMEERLKVRESKEQELIEYKKQLEAIQAKEEDKKRDLAEKLAHRESLLADMKARQEALEKAYQEQIHQKEIALKKYEAEFSAQTEVYKQRLETELSVIPDKFKEIANLIVKGSGDPRDALVALSEAKIRGIFEDKTVVVNHSVPGANDGARVTKDRLDQTERDRREKMNSQALIGEALKNIRSGTPNSAFRSNK